MKVLFLLPGINSKVSWHCGIASMATYLRKNDHQTEILEISNYGLAAIEYDVNAYKPDVVAGTVNSHQFPFIQIIQKVIKHIKKQRSDDVYTVVGGVHVTIAPESIKTMEKAIEDIRLASEQYNFKRFVIDDDIFTLKKHGR